MKIKWVGPVGDSSGYAANSRMFVQALWEYRGKYDLELAVQPVSFENQVTDQGKAGEICEQLSSVQMKEDVKIINTTPEFYHKLKGPAINIAYTTFETDRIPDLWVEELNKMDGVLTTASWCVDVFRNSGVTVPIFESTPGIIPEEYDLRDPVERVDVPDGAFSFYSIFQWTKRKAPEALLRAYWAEFEKQDDVVLVLKTYRNDTSRQQQDEIRKLIKWHKSNFNLKRHPKILYIPRLLTRQQIVDLHLSCDCFVLPHRAEGQGLPHFDATAFGRPVITTGFSGNMDFTRPEFSYLVDYQMTPCAEQPWTPWYEGTMNWAEPDVVHLRKLMREVYENRAEADERGKAGREYLLENFNWDKKMGTLMDAVNKIVEGVK